MSDVHPSFDIGGIPSPPHPKTHDTSRRDALLGLALAIPLLVVMSLIALVIVVRSGIIAPRSTAVAFAMTAAFTTASLGFVSWWGRPRAYPRTVAVMLFLWGALAVGPLVASAQMSADNVLAAFGSVDFASQWGAAIVAPPTEEPVKLCGLIYLLLFFRKSVPDVHTGAALGAIVGIGYQGTESLMYATMYADDVLPDDVGMAATVLGLRFTLTGLISHPLMTATAAAGLTWAALNVDRPHRVRVGVALLAFGGACLIHVSGNSPLLTVVTDPLRGFPATLVALSVIVAPGVPAAWWLMRLRRSEMATPTAGTWDWKQGQGRVRWALLITATVGYVLLTDVVLDLAMRRV